MAAVTTAAVKMAAVTKATVTMTAVTMAAVTMGAVTKAEVTKAAVTMVAVAKAAVTMTTVTTAAVTKAAVTTAAAASSFLQIEPLHLKGQQHPQEPLIVFLCQSHKDFLTCEWKSGHNLMIPSLYFVGSISLICTVHSD